MSYYVVRYIFNDVVPHHQGQANVFYTKCYMNVLMRFTFASHHWHSANIIIDTQQIMGVVNVSPIRLPYKVYCSFLFVFFLRTLTSRVVGFFNGEGSRSSCGHIKSHENTVSVENKWISGNPRRWWEGQKGRRRRLWKMFEAVSQQHDSLICISVQFSVYDWENLFCWWLSLFRITMVI